MSFWYGEVDEDPRPTFGGGSATTGEILEAARDATLYAGNWNASDLALEEAYDRRIAAIKRATNVDLDNPMRAVPPLGVGPDFALQNARRGEVMREGRAAFDRRVGELMTQYSGRMEGAEFGRPIDREAEMIARDSESRLGTLLASRPGLAGTGAAFAGSFLGSLRDPLQTATLVLGGGPGAARTIAGRILSTTAREALLNAGTEAAAQPRLQEWRARAGLDAGFDDAVKQILFAGTVGALVGGAARGAFEGGRALLRGRAAEDAAVRAAPAAAEGSLARRALAGEERAAEQLARPLRDRLSPSARGALDALEADRLMQGSALPHLGAASDDFLARAIRAAEDPAALPDFLAGTSVFDRLLTGGAPVPAGSRPRWLAEAREPLGQLDLGPDDPRPAIRRRKEEAAAARQAKRIAREAAAIEADLAGVNARLGTDEDFAAMRAEVDAASAELLDAAIDPKKTPKRRAAAEKRATARLAAIAPRFNEEQRLRLAAEDLRARLGALPRRAEAAEPAMPDMPPPAVPPALRAMLAATAPRIAPEPPAIVRETVEVLAAAQDDVADGIEIPVGTRTDGAGETSVVTMTLREAVETAGRDGDLADLVEACKVLR